MTRKASLVTAIVLTFGFVVAIVRAQDSSRDGAYPTENRRQRSVLKKSFRGREASPVIGSRGTESEGVGSSSHPIGSGVRDDVSSRPPLVDRLKQIRGSVTGESRPPRAATSNAAPRGAAPTRIPSAVEAPRRLHETDGPINSEPRLLPGQFSRGSLRPSQSPPSVERQPATRGAMADRSESARRSRRIDPPANVHSNQFSVDDATTKQPEPGQAVASPVFQDALAQREIQHRMDAPSVLLSSEGPAVLVDTIGPPAIVVGQETEYQISLTNQSRVPAHDVFVRIALPTWVEIAGAEVTAGSTQVKGGETSAQELIWKATQFGAGARELLSLKVIPRENRSFNLAVDWTLRPVTSVAQIQVQQPELQMAVLGPDRIGYGETAVYKIQLSNPGTGQAEDVMVDFGYGSEQLPPKRIGTLAAGETTDVLVELSARHAGILRVAASATAAGGLTADSTKEVQVQRAKLAIEVIGSRMLFAGTAAHYDFQVRNDGDADALNVVAEVMLPPGAKYMGKDSVGRASDAVTKQLGTISPGSERRFRLTCQLTNPGENRVEARAIAGGNLTAADSFATRVESIADLKLNVNDSPGPIPVDTDTVYELHIVNRGTRAAKDIQIVAQFSEGVEPVSASGTGSRLVPGQVLFQAIPRIQPGEEIRLRITAKADIPGNHRFRAELKCSDPIGTVLSEEESTYFFSDEVSTAGRQDGTTIK